MPSTQLEYMPWPLVWCADDFALSESGSRDQRIGPAGAQDRACQASTVFAPALDDAGVRWARDQALCLAAPR